MTPQHHYWLNYGVNSPRGWGEGSTEVSTPEPITTGDQLRGLSRILAENYGGQADIIVRNFTFLREEPDE